MASKQGKLVRQASIEVTPGLPNPEQAKKWLKQQVPYKNLAGISDDLDARASAFVNDRKQQFLHRMHAPMRRWAMNWATANTEALWQEHEDDVHIPETKKALDSKVARIEEAITQFDPVFEVEGTMGDLSHNKAKVIESYIYRKMELANWHEYVQPIARDGELCNVMAIKVAWEHLVEDVIEAKTELRYGKDKPEYHVERRMRKAVARSGVRFHQVDPFWLIYDLDAPNIQEAAYVGDESLVYLHELEAQAKQGIFPVEQVRKLRERVTEMSSNRSADNTARAEWPDMLRRSRSIAMGPEHSQDIHGEHGARKIRVVEMWAWFDFGDGIDGVTHPTGERIRGTQRVVVTVANGIVLRFQLNPFDRKFVPYAVSRINRNGHEMVAPAPFDSVVQTNAHYDRVSSNIMRYFDLAVSPLIVADSNSDLPDTILEVQPGTVLKHTGNWDFIKINDIGSIVPYVHNFFRREVEETSGALRVFESPQGTATETERKVQEQQRMVRNSIRANAELWRPGALLTHYISAQFATGPERFRVIGKGSKFLNRYATMTPEVLQEDVEFHFLALTDLHTFGNRLQGMRQWMNAWGPLLPNMPEVNMRALCRKDFELSVGHSEAADIFPSAPAPWETWTQEEENAMLLSGNAVPVNENDDDENHLEVLMPMMRRQDLPQYIIDNIADHIQQHIAQLQRKEAEKNAERQQSQRRGEMLQTMGGVPGVDRAPVEGGMEAQPRDVTPGPQQSRTVARTGRTGAGISQTQAMGGEA